MRIVGYVLDQRKSNPGRPALFGEQHTSFVTNEMEKGRNRKPHSNVAFDPLILKEMVKSKLFQTVPTPQWITS